MSSHSGRSYAARDSEIEHLKLVIAKLRRMMFGTKSEKVTGEIEQLELKLELLETHRSERSATTAAVTDGTNKPTRRPLPEHLPREVQTHHPAAIYTLLRTVKINNLDPELYLRHVLERIADHPINRIRELLPRNLAALSSHLA